MGFVKIKHDLVDTRWEQGKTVAEQWFKDIEHLLHIGAVERVATEDVPADAVQAPAGSVEATVEEPPAEPEAESEPVAVEPEPAVAAEPEPVAIEPEPVVEPAPAPISRSRHT